MKSEFLFPSENSLFFFSLLSWSNNHLKIEELKLQKQEMNGTLVDAFDRYCYSMGQ
jgi:hypothetical protein